MLPGAEVQVETVGGDTVTYAFTDEDPSGTKGSGTVRVDRTSLPRQLVLTGADGVTVAYSSWGEVDPPVEAPAPGDMESAKG